MMKFQPDKTSGDFQLHGGHEKTETIMDEALGTIMYQKIQRLPDDIAKALR
jgi:hypothetical protein